MYKESQKKCELLLLLKVVIHTFFWDTFNVSTSIQTNFPSSENVISYGYGLCYEGKPLNILNSQVLSIFTSRLLSVKCMLSNQS